MRKRLAILAVLLVPLAGVWLVWQLAYDGADPRVVFWPPSPEPRPSAALDELAEIHVEGQLFRNVLDQIADAYFVDIEIDDAALKQAGIGDNQRLTLDMEGLTLRSLLDVLVRQVDAKLMVGERGDRLVVTTRSQWQATINNQATRIYRLDELLAGADARCDEQVIAEVVQAVAAVEEVQPLPGALLVKALPEQHRDVEALLDGLARMQQEPHRREPLTIGVSPAVMDARSKLIQALDQPSSLEATDASLADMFDSLSKQHGIPILLDQTAIESEIGGEIEKSLTYSISLRDVTLRSALRTVLRDFEVGYVVRDAAILVTTWEFAERQPIVRLYPIADLADARLPPESIRDIITSTVEPDGWQDVGGPYVAACAGDTLVVTENDRGHERIEEVLADLRHVSRPALEPPASTPVDLAERRIRDVLAEPFTFDVDDGTIADAARSIARQRNINVVLDRRALDGVGIGSDTPVFLPPADLPLKHALSLMLRELGLTYHVRDETLSITTPEEAEASLVTRFYRTPQVLQSRVGDAWVDALVQIVEPVSWEDVGGPGNIETYGDFFVVSQTEDVLDRVELFLAMLDDAVEHARDRTTPIDIVDPPDELHRRCIAALEEKTSIDVDGEPLVQVVEELSHRHNVPITFHQRDLNLVGTDRDLPITAHLTGVSLRAALNSMVHELDLAISIQHGTLCFSHKYGEWLMVRAYPVADLTDNWRTKSVEALAEALQAAGAMGWEQQGRAYSIRELGGVLLIATTPDVHAQIEQLLAMLRNPPDRALDDLPFAAGYEPGGRSARILQRLDQISDANIEAANVCEAVEQLAAQHGLPLSLDRPTIERNGVLISSPVRFSLAGATLGRLLELLLDRHDLGYAVWEDSLIVTSDRETQRGSQPTLPIRVFPIGDLRRRFPLLFEVRKASRRRSDDAFVLYGGNGFGAPSHTWYLQPPVPEFAPSFENQLVAAIRACAENATGHVAAFGDLLFVSGPPAFQRAAERVLARLRNPRSDDEAESLLDRPVSLHCENLPLDEAVARLSRENGLPVLLVHDDPGRRDPFRRDVDWKPAAAYRAACRIDGLPLREAIARLSPVDLPLAACVEDGVVIVDSRVDFELRPLVRFYPLEGILQSFPELDTDWLRRLVELADRLSPVNSSSTDIAPDAFKLECAPLPSLLAVRHTAAGQAQIERLLSFVEQQADRSPRPYELLRDNPRAAIAALARRMNDATDPLEIAWLAMLTLTVDEPAEELGAAVSRHLLKTDVQGNSAYDRSMCEILSHCGTAPPDAMERFAAVLAQPPDAETRRTVTTTLAALGPDGIDVLVRRLEQIAGEVDKKSQRESESILDILFRCGANARGAIPALVELLVGIHGYDVRQALHAIDPGFEQSQAYVRERLADPNLSQAEQEHFKSLREVVKEAKERPFGSRFWGP
jgi:hypothetical protein